MAKTYKITKIIDGTEYVAQFAGCSVALKATDECKDKDGNLSNYKTSQYLLDNVIVKPRGLTVDDFDDIEKLGNVTAFAGEVMSGNLKPNDEETEEKEEVEEKKKAKK